jgi:hypothetical protein
MVDCPHYAHGRVDRANTRDYSASVNKADTFVVNYLQANWFNIPYNE